LERNLVYMTVGSVTYGKSVNYGILLGDELYTPPSDHITVINNVAYGNNLNLKWHRGDYGHGVMKNVLIANNTLVDAMPNNQSNCNIDISDGPKENVRILNNIIIQSDGQQIEDIKMSTGGIMLANNLWSKAPHAAVLGSGSIIGNAKLANPGQPYNPASYMLTSESPAINKALPLTEVADDFFLNAREVSPDIGALEYVTGQ
jgi:hypothetical protein